MMDPQHGLILVAFVLVVFSLIQGATFLLLREHVVELENRTHLKLRRILELLENNPPSTSKCVCDGRSEPHAEIEWKDEDLKRYYQETLLDASEGILWPYPPLAFLTLPSKSACTGSRVVK